MCINYNIGTKQVELINELKQLRRRERGDYKIA